MKFTSEQIEKAKITKNVEELLTLAKENGIDLTIEEAKKYFESFQNESISDDELANVSGGCGKPDPKFPVGQRVETNIRYKFLSHLHGYVEYYIWDGEKKEYKYTVKYEEEPEYKCDFYERDLKFA